MTPGQLIGGRFEVERLAGRGGMSQVYLARDRERAGPVALKLLEDPGEHAGRFEREVRILEQLEHPHVVRYIADGRTAEGRRFLVLEWLEGEDLEARLARGALSLAEAVALVGSVAGALGAAHRRGITHRDVKPSNLFLGGGAIERIKLLDFGIAHLATASVRLTGHGTTVGTPAYMAPEQARGHRAVGPSADVFSLGCVLFECLTGRAAFAGEHVMAVLAKVLFEEPPRLGDVCPGVPAELDELAARMLAKDPELRPRDGAQVAGALAEIDLSGAARPLLRSERPAEITAGERRLLSVVLAAADRAHGEAPTLAAGEDRPRGLRERIEALGGRFEAVADGSLVVTLSGTAAATDQAAQAARCALAVRAAAPGLAVALATGHGVFADRWPVGEVIDRAAALLRRSSEAGAHRSDPVIAIDEVTAGLLDARFEIGGDEAGLALLGERDAVDSARRLLGKPTPCVGRDRELGELRAMLRECAEEPVARAALVTGAAGLGKSRLRYELLRELAGRGGELGEAGPALVLVARGDPMSAGSPFGLLAPAIRRAAAVVDGEPLAVRQRKLRARVARHVPEPEARRVTEFVGELAGIPFPEEDSLQLRAARQDATLMGDQMLRAFEDLLAAECEVGPVLVVLEDLHHGDLPTVRFVDAALRNLADRPLMVLALARPEVHELFPRLWHERPLTEVRLGPLGARAAERLVRAVLPSIDPARCAAVVEQAGGNAFYLEELVRAVAEGKEELPPTVLAMVQARLEALEPDARRVLRAAAVFGQVFWRGGVAALLGGGARGEALAAWLPLLVDRELVERRPDSRLAAEEELVFRNAAVREAAYAMLTDDDRVTGHRLAGAWLERAGESDAIVLAEHFDRGGSPERAAGWFRRGAEQALEGHDLAAALDRADRGVRCGASGELYAALRLLEAEAHRWRGDFSRAEGAALDAAAHLGRGSAAWFRAIEEAMSAAGRRGDYHLAASLAEAPTAPAPGAESAEISCACAAARQLFHAGRYDAAGALIDRVTALAASSADLDPRALAEVHRLRGARARHVGDLSGDLAGYEAALGAFTRAGDERNACNAEVSLGFAYIELGDFDRALAALERGLAAAERLGLWGVSARARQNLSLVFAARGDLAAARQAADAAIEVARAQGNTRFEGWTRIYQSSIAAQAGDFGAAEAEARHAAELLSLTPPARAGALAALSIALAGQARAAEALPAAQEAMQVLAALGGIEEFESLIRLAHVEALLATGDRAAAAGALAAARARLAERAAAIEDPRRARSFLESVPENARLAALGAV